MKPKVELQTTHRPGVMSEASPGVRAALDMARRPKGKPSEHDAPPPSTFPGKVAKPIPGQLELGE